MQSFVEKMQKAAGRPLRIDESVYKSETATGHRNRAIAYLMLNYGIIDEAIDHTLHQYFSQCSLLVNCRDLAMMAVTLANMGNNPVTNDAVFDFEYVKDVLTVMFTCGLYDYAGGWAYEVGVPAKSGVGGGIIAVVNRQMGIAVYSPRLDAKGNSVRGIMVCRGDRETPRPACVRVHECGIELHAVNALDVSPAGGKNAPRSSRLLAARSV